MLNLVPTVLNPAGQSAGGRFEVKCRHGPAVQHDHLQSSPLFNTSIVNRTGGTNKNLIIQPGKYNVTMNFNSNTPNALSFGFNKIVLNLAFTVQTASVGRRW